MRKRKQWTPADIRQLKLDARRHIAAPQIAKKLRRTEGATRQKACAMGLSLETRV
jgi:hypothetical protein